MHSWEAMAMADKPSSPLQVLPVQETMQAIGDQQAPNLIQQNSALGPESQAANGEKCTEQLQEAGSDPGAGGRELLWFQ